MAMYFTDTEHRLLLAAIEREKEFVKNDKDLSKHTGQINLVEALEIIKNKLSKLQNKKGPWISVNDSKKPKDREQVLVKLSNDCCYLARYATDLYKVDKYDFSLESGKAGFYCYDSETGYYPLDGVIKWMKIPKEVIYV